MLGMSSFETAVPWQPIDDPAGSSCSQPVTIIERRTGWRALDLRDLWWRRELLYYLVWRDVTIRYKQSVFGIGWALIQPLGSILVFSLLFGRWVGLDEQTGEIPYPVFVFSGLLPWQLFSRSLLNASNSVVSNGHILTKIYFPRLLAPLSSLGSVLLDVSIGFVALMVMMIVFGVAVGLQVLLLPLILLLICLAALSVGIWLSAVYVAYRDVQQVAPFLISLWMWLSPVVYPPTIVPASYRWVLAFNPMTGLIAGFRYSLLGQPMDWPALGVAAAMILVAFPVSIYYFRRKEHTFADII